MTEIPQWAIIKPQYIYNYWKDAFLIFFWFIIKAKSQIPIQKASVNHNKISIKKNLNKKLYDVLKHCSKTMQFSLLSHWGHYFETL